MVVCPKCGKNVENPITEKDYPFYAVHVYSCDCGQQFKELTAKYP
jgi:hypothetical protein